MISQNPSTFDLDKRSSSLSVHQSTLMYPLTVPSSSVLPPAFSEYPESTWSPDPSNNDLKRWQEQDRRSPIGMTNRFSQAYLSECRTTINDSPAFQPLLLSNNTPVPMIPSISSSTNSHVTRRVDFMDTEDEMTDTSTQSQWQHWSGNFPYNDRATHDHRLSRSSTSSPDWPNSLNMQQMSFEPQPSWNNMMMDSAPPTPYTPQQNMSLNGYMFPHRFSPLPSPSPPPTYQEAVVFQTRPKAETHSSRTSIDASGNVKKCSHCQATTTPLWRRDPSTFKPLCNACGLYLQQRNRHRPQELIEADTDDGDTTDESDQNYVGPECSHCHTHHTSVWRRSKTGAQLCNACGVYQRLRGKPRPLSLKRNKIKPRSKHPKP